MEGGGKGGESLFATCVLFVDLHTAFFHILYHQVLLAVSDGETVPIVVVPASQLNIWQRKV